MPPYHTHLLATGRSFLALAAAASIAEKLVALSQVQEQCPWAAVVRDGWRHPGGPWPNQVLEHWQDIHILKRGQHAVVLATSSQVALFEHAGSWNAGAAALLRPWKEDPSALGVLATRLAIRPAFGDITCSLLLLPLLLPPPALLRLPGRCHAYPRCCHCWCCFWDGHGSWCWCC